MRKLKKAQSGGKIIAKQDNTSVYNPLSPVNLPLELSKKKVYTNQVAQEKDKYYNPEVKKGITSGDKMVDFLYNNQYLMDIPVVRDIIKNKAKEVAINSGGLPYIQRDKKGELNNNQSKYNGSINNLNQSSTDGKSKLLDQYFSDKDLLPKSKYKPLSDYMTFLPSYSVKENYDNFINKGKDYKKIGNAQFKEALNEVLPGKDLDGSQAYNTDSIYNAFLKDHKTRFGKYDHDTALTGMIDQNLGGHKEGIAWDKDKNLPYISLSDAWDFEPEAYSKKWSSEYSNEARDRAYIQASLMHKAGNPYKVYDRFYFNPNTKEYIPDSNISKSKKQNGGIARDNTLVKSPIIKDKVLNVPQLSRDLQVNLTGNKDLPYEYKDWKDLPDYITTWESSNDNTSKYATEQIKPLLIKDNKYNIRNNEQVNPNMLDDLIKAAVKSGLDPYTALAIAQRESGLGNSSLPGKKSSSTINEAYPHRIFSNWDMMNTGLNKDELKYILDKDGATKTDSSSIPAKIGDKMSKFVKDNTQYPFQAEMNTINKKTKNGTFIRGYNYGDPDYTNKVAKEREILMSPENEAFRNYVDSVAKTVKKQKGGAVTNAGYLSDSPDRFNDYNIIPNNQITMKGVKHKVLGTDNKGNQQMMYPGMEYSFPGDYVTEVPIKQMGGMQRESTAVNTTPLTLPMLKQSTIDFLKSRNVDLKKNPNLIKLLLDSGNPDVYSFSKDNPGLINKYLFGNHPHYNPVTNTISIKDNQLKGEEYNNFIKESSKADADQYNKARRIMSVGTLQSELPHAIQFNNSTIGSIGKWLGNDLVDYSKGKSPYKDKQSLEYDAHSTKEKHEDIYYNFADGGINKSNPKFLDKVGTYANGVASTQVDYINNPYSFDNVLETANDITNLFTQKSQNNYNKDYLMDNMGTDAIFPVLSSNGTRGDYSVTGSDYGQFRPNQMGEKSPYGMNNGNYYPKLQSGGYIADAVDNTPQYIGDTSSSQYVGPEFAMPTFNPVTNNNYKTDYIPDNSAKVNSNTKDAYKYYTQEKGLPSHIAAGIVGNLYQESGLKPGAVEQTNTANGRGIAQWDVRDRWQGFLGWSKEQRRDPYDLRTQLDYVLVEPGQSDKVLEKLKNSKTPEQAAVIFGKLYERPSEKFANWGTRTGIAKKLSEGTYQEGGEYEMSISELNQFLKDGGEIE